MNFIQYQITFDRAELRAVIKSLSIGCDQLSKKLERMSTTQYHADVESELKLLMSAVQKLNAAMYEGLEGDVT